MLSKSEIINKFAKYNISLHPAGIWEFDAEGKKTPKVAYRVDGLAIDSYPDDNMFKLRIEKTPYMVIDVDGGDIAELYQMFPSIAKTLTTTTTADNKFHIYIQRPEEFPLTRIVNALPKIDILSNGIVFEGHLYNINEHYDIEGKDIVELTQDEILKLKGFVPKGQINKVSNDDLLCRYSMGEYEIIKEYLDDSLQNKTRLWGIFTKGAGRPKSKAPDLSYTTINDLGFWLAINAYIPHTMVIKFLEKVLVKEYELSLSSSQTQQRLYKQIIPTLPIIENNDFDDSFTSFMAKLPTSRNGQCKLVGTIDAGSGTLKYIMLDKYTHTLYAPNKSKLLTKQAVEVHFPHIQSDQWKVVPQVEITEDPFAPMVSYNSKYDVFTISLLPQSQYIINVGPLETKPSNILTKAISEVFTPTEEMHMMDDIDPEDFYYHWLAHVLFGELQINTILCLATSKQVLGATGKSTLTAKIPQHILPLGASWSPGEEAAKWDNTFDEKRLVALDDLNESKNWGSIYTTLKQTTSGTVRTINQKGGALKMSDGAGPGISVSANFYPSIDSSDRRFFLWAPTGRLSKEDGLLVSKIMLDRKKHHIELQEITNYCYYLYTEHKDKYWVQLFNERPETSLWRSIATDGATGSRLIALIKAGPLALFDAFVPNKSNVMSHRDIVELLVMQIVEPNNRSTEWAIQMPTEGLKYIYNCTRSDNEVLEWPTRTLLKTLEISQTSLSNKAFAEKYQDWSQRGYRIGNVSQGTIQQYKEWLKYNKPNSKKEEITIDV